MGKNITRLRYVKSKSADNIVEYTEKLLSYKIEVKGSPQFAQGKWWLWFNLPDDLIKEMFWGDLDL